MYTLAAVAQAAKGLGVDGAVFFGILQAVLFMIFKIGDVVRPHCQDETTKNGGNSYSSAQEMSTTSGYRASTARHSTNSPDRT